MRVRVHEAGQDDAPPRVQHLTVPADERLDLRARPRAADAIPFDEHRAVFDDRQLAQLGPHARARRPGERDELRAVDDSEHRVTSEVYL